MSADCGWGPRRFLMLWPRCAVSIFVVGIVLAVPLASCNAQPSVDTRDKATFTALAAPILQAAARDEADFHRRVAALNLDRIFSAELVASDPDMTRAKAKIAEARSLADLYRDRERQRRGELIALIDKADVSQNFKNGAWKASRAQDASGANDGRWSALSAYHDSLDNAADVFAQTRSRWSVTNGELVFREQADIDRIQRSYAAIQQSAAALNEVVLDATGKRKDAVQYLGQPEP